MPASRSSARVSVFLAKATILACRMCLVTHKTTSITSAMATADNQVRTSFPRKLFPKISIETSNKQFSNQ